MIRKATFILSIMVGTLLIAGCLNQTDFEASAAAEPTMDLAIVTWQNHEGTGQVTIDLNQCNEPNTSKAQTVENQEEVWKLLNEMAKDGWMVQKANKKGMGKTIVLGRAPNC